MAKKFKKVDNNVKMTEMLIARTEQNGLLPWMKGWDMVEGFSPLNFDSGRVYKGFTNSLICAMGANGRLPLFGTFNREKHPAKKGAKAIYLWKPCKITYEDKKSGKEKTFLKFDTVALYHYTDLKLSDEQIEKIESKYAPKTEGEPRVFNAVAECEAVIDAMPNRPEIDHNGGNSAYYTPSKDSVSMPKREQFHTEEEYYCTLFHELAHSTGHFTRLDRFKKTKEIFNSNHKKEYSFEELVAELTACFIGSETGILSDRKFDNSASYIKGWCSKLQSNPDWIMKACSYASHASNYILNKTAPVYD